MKKKTPQLMSFVYWFFFLKKIKFVKRNDEVVRV